MLKVYGLKTEYLVNPIGIDARRPRFSWKIESDQRNVKQDSYKIIAHSNGTLLYDSGIVKSDESQRIKYEGPELKSTQRVEWYVTVVCGTEQATSESAFFEIGLLHESDWVAKWIEPEDTVDPDVMQPAPYLRKKFIIKPGLVKARIYQTAHGLYEFWLNGEKGTEDRFKPGLTSYYRRIQYQTYDITGLLTKGENTWSVTLGDGWWRGLCGGVARNNFGYKLHYMGQIILTYADESQEIIATDESFKTATGGLRLSDMKAGDIFDARQEPAGWKKVDFDDTAWKNVHIAKDKHCDNALLIASRSVPVRELERFNPKVIKDSKGDTILDFGQNIAGYVDMTLRGTKEGQEIILVHGEDMKDGIFSVANICMNMPHEDRIQHVNYIAKGADIEQYCPMFSVFGFRYVKITGYDNVIDPNDFTALAVYSSMETTGEFRCSNQYINQLISNSLWSQKGNFLDVPTDCPTRERSPWTGDAQAYCKTAADFMNVYPFFEKWMQDLNLEQLESGKILNTFPSTNIMQNIDEINRTREKFKAAGVDPSDIAVAMRISDMSNGSMIDGSTGWSDTAVIIPYTMYLCYGDKQILENQYESAKKYVDYMFSRAKNINENRKEAPEYSVYTDGECDGDYIWDTEYHWGEWLEADSSLMVELGNMAQKLTNPDPEVPTAFMCYSTRLFSKIARILGKDKIADEYLAKSEKVKLMFNKYLIKPEGFIKPGRQAPNVRALAFDLCLPENKDAVTKKLVEMLRENGYHLNTGFLATPFILTVLADNGYADIAFKVLEQDTTPSWLYNIKLGATTILEEWRGMETHTGSYNHYSYGAVCDFLFSRLGGILPIIEEPGYKQFTIRPYIGGTLEFAMTSFESQYGMIKSEWKLRGEKVSYDFVVPVNTIAELQLAATKSDVQALEEQFGKVVFSGGIAAFSVGSGSWHTETTRVTRNG